MPRDATRRENAEIDARLQVAISRTSQILSEEETHLVRKNIAKSLDLRRQLRAVNLENHDEPEYGFDPGANRGPIVQKGRA